MEDDIVNIGTTSRHGYKFRPRRRVNYTSPEPIQSAVQSNHVRSVIFKRPVVRLFRLNDGLLQYLEQQRQIKKDQALLIDSLTKSLPEKKDQETNTDFGDQPICKICFTNEVNVSIISCGHVICDQCASSLEERECPFCRKFIRRGQFIFFP